MAKKSLYKCKKFEDLEEYVKMPDLRAKSTKMLLNTARKLQTTAEDYRLQGDEELAYITFVKYFSIIHYIRQKSDYSQNKQLVREILGDNNTNRHIMDTLEMLSDSLSKRYKELEQVNSNANSNGSLISGRTEQIGDAGRQRDNEMETANDSVFANIGLISCANLFNRMQDKTVLVMDCRPSVDYDISHLNYYCAFNVPEELITPGMSAGRLQARLSSSSKASWAARSVKDSVVLMDWNTKDSPPASNAPIATLLDILKNWDPDVIYRSPIQILDGGYEYFIMMYPTMCTNPSVQAPKQNNNELEALEDIEYPSINDITMKEDIKARDFSLLVDDNGPPSKQRPSIDRSSKEVAMRTYEKRSKNITEIIHEHAELLRKAHENDILLENASKKWQNIYELKRLHESGERLSSSDQELCYNIMQLETTAEDYKNENMRLRDELNHYKEQNQQMQQKQQDVEAAKEVESQILQRQKLDAQIERQRLEREHQRSMAQRLNKMPVVPEPKYEPKFEPEPDNDAPAPGLLPNAPSPILDNLSAHVQNFQPDNALIPLRPTYDRAMKPQQLSNVMPTSPPTVNRKRDFSPVYGNQLGPGLTGLKNLGNTCYMNSILQCLSNTPQLTEYCLSGNYWKNIRRNNKTQGQVIEEVAALIKELWLGNYKCVASKDLRYVMGQYLQIFRGVDQQDSHEFLTILMDWLHSDLQTMPVKPCEIVSASEKAWLEFTKAKESLILHLFYGQMKSTVKCVACHKESATYECFSNLSLELPPNANSCYLAQCMDMYFSGEHIHGWNCPSCKTKRDAIKKLDISKLPPVLIVHLKRFYADPSGSGSYIKKQNFLRFPLENLNMTPYIARAESRTNTPKSYKLYGVSNHYGSMESGHYTAFCKNTNLERWFKFDDQIVSTLSASNVVSSAAYILFYTWLPSLHVAQ